MVPRKAYISAIELSSELGLPLVWLKNEGQARRIPCLEVGRRLLFDLDAVRQALAERAGRETGVPDSRPQPAKFNGPIPAKDQKAIGMGPRKLQDDGLLPEVKP